MGKFADLDDAEIQPGEAVGSAKIGTAGIHHNITLKSVTLEQKPATVKEGVVTKKAFVAAKFEFENPNGEVHEEMYFKPAEDVSQLNSEKDWTPDKYEDLEGNGKKVKTGKVSKEKYVQILNNDYAFFWLDLAVALGYSAESVKKIIAAADTFEELTETLIKKLCGPGLEKRKISMKLLWDNNDKEQTSYLRLHTFLAYYPYQNKYFDTYAGDESKVKLFISEFEHSRRGERAHENKRKPTGAGVNTGGAVKGERAYTTPTNTKGTGTVSTRPTANSSDDEEDPF